MAQAFLLDILERLAAIDAVRLLAFAPPTAHAAFAAMAQGRYHLLPQVEGALGQRMAAFFTEQVRASTAVVLVGTDSPTLPTGFIEQAFVELATADIVLGPATDGGYYLIGCAGRVPPLLVDIPWSTSQVLFRSVLALRDPAWRLAVLPPWYDVDTLDDWQMLRGHVLAQRRAGQEPGVPHTERLLQEPAP